MGRACAQADGADSRAQADGADSRAQAEDLGPILSRWDANDPGSVHRGPQGGTKIPIISRRDRWHAAC